MTLYCSLQKSFSAIILHTHCIYRCLYNLCKDVITDESRRACIPWTRSLSSFGSIQYSIVISNRFSLQFLLIENLLLFPLIRAHFLTGMITLVAWLSRLRSLRRLTKIFSRSHINFDIWQGNITTM